MIIEINPVVESLKIPQAVKEEINAVIDSLLDKFFGNISKIILFGSFCDGTYQPDSDIDIAVTLNEVPPVRERRHYYRQIPYTEREIDLLFCTEEQLNSENFVYKYVKSKGILLYEQL